MTMDVYYHWIPGKKKSEVDELDKLHPDAPYSHPTTPKNEKWDSKNNLTH
jgi:hypothetical protein